VGCIHPHSASRSPNIFQWSADIASRLQLLIALLISVARESHDVHGMLGMYLLSASSANRFTGAYHGVDHAHSAGWSFGDFSSRTSMLACPTPVCTGINLAFRPLTQCFPALPPFNTYSSHKGSSTAARTQ